MALDIIPGNPDLAAKAFADLKVDLDGERPPSSQLRSKSLCCPEQSKT
jgi:hypothetical protein